MKSIFYSYKKLKELFIKRIYLLKEFIYQKQYYNYQKFKRN